MRLRIIFSAIATCLTMVASHAASTRPNIVLIVADDMRADTIAASGNEHVATPNLDRLIKRGTSFDQAYTMGATTSAVGASTRAAMLSSRSLFRFGEDIENLDDDFPLLPEVLRERGYSTFATGRWVNGRNWFQRSFTHGEAIFFGDPTSHKGLKVHRFDPTGEYAEDDTHTTREFSSEAFANAFAKFLDNRPRGKPFFAYVGFTAPRIPRTTPSGVRPTPPPLPVNFTRQHPFDNGALAGPEEKILALPRVPKEIQRELASYYSMVTHMDHQIGSMLYALETSGLMENTIVVFTSDSGLAVGSHGLLGKQNLYEHSIKVPLVLHGPGIPRDARYLSLCYQMDLFPTICELTRSNIPDTIEGKSLVPILTANASDIRATIFTAFGDSQRSVRDHRYKLVFYPKIERFQLFNLRNDPDEVADLFESAEHGREINRLRIQLTAWQSSLGDPLR